MKFTSPEKVWECAQNMRQSDVGRATNRALVDSLFNGSSPFTPGEQAQNNIETNVNFLDATRLAHDMRRQYSNAFLKPGNFFKVTLEHGPTHKRAEWSRIITEQINGRMKRGKSALRYRETLRNVFAQVTLHGVGPVVWEDEEKWCPMMQMMGDLFIPSRTLLTMENLGHYASYRRYTAAELWRKTHGPNFDPGWNKELVNQAIKWAVQQWTSTQSAADFDYSPERLEEDFKSDTGFWASDAIPTINCYDFRCLEDEGKDMGWKRRVILDVGAGGEAIIPDHKNQFLYSSKDKTFAPELSRMLHFQFADGSVVAPFRYHSVRSLGFLLYSVCHLQNRLRCKFNDSVFESLLNYFRVSNPEDKAKMLKLDLQNFGVIPDGVQMVPRNDRWQVDQQLVQTAMVLNKQSMAENSTSFTQDFGHGEDAGVEKTATQITAEVNASTALVGAMLMESYGYQEFQYYEIGRRFCIKNSCDQDVVYFRNACLKQGVPEEMLNADRWRISAERVIGNGNKQLEMASVQMLMQQIDRYEPDAQREIMRLYTFAAMDDAAMTNLLVPETPVEVTSSVHDAQLACATLLMGLPMGLKQGTNHVEYASVLIGALGFEVQKIVQSGGMATQEQIAGFQNIAGQSIDGKPIPGNGAANHIAILAQSKSNNQVVKQLNDLLGKQMNEVKGLAQRLQEQQAQPQNGNGQLDPETAVKLKGQLVISEAKARNMEADKAHKLSIKEETHRQRMDQNIESAQLANANKIRETQINESALDIKTAAEIRRQATEPEI